MSLEICPRSPQKYNSMRLDFYYPAVWRLLRPSEKLGCQGSRGDKWQELWFSVCPTHCHQLCLVERIEPQKATKQLGNLELLPNPAADKSNKTSLLSDISSAV